MYPILFEIPGLGFPLRSFGALVALGFLLGSFLLGRMAARYGDDPARDPDRYAKVTVWVLVGVIAGARLLYVVVEVAKELSGPGDPMSAGRLFLDSPLHVFAFWEGGLVMYGGFLGAVLLGLWSARREGLRPLHALDLGLIPGFVGLAVGRVGCLLVGDDHGSVVPDSLRDLPFPLVIHVPDPLPVHSLFERELAGQVLWATQPWMTINALLLATIGWLILRRRKYVGQVTVWMVLLYSVTRFTIEHFRGDAVRGIWFGGALSTSQLIAVVSGAVALVVMLRRRLAVAKG